MLFLPAPIRAADNCEALAERAGAEAGVPEGLMAAIARVESGRGDGAWPWTLNQGGKGMFLATRAEAVARLSAVVASGVTNIDVGCMQLNWRWHGPAFDSADEMIDPVRNTRHAARFLVELRARLGSWQAAAAAYHSSDRARGAAYLAKVESARGGLRLADAGGDLPTSAVMQAARIEGLLVLAPQPMVAVQTQAVAVVGPVPDAATGLIPSAGPFDLAPATAEMFEAADLPPRLRARWQAVESFRAALAEQP